MQRRALLSIANLTVAGAALVVWFRFPQYAYYAVFALFGWFVVSFSLAWTVRGAPAAATARSAPAARPGGAGAPGSAGPASPGAPPPADIPFCIYCAADLPRGAPLCPACGHVAPHLG